MVLASGLEQSNGNSNSPSIPSTPGKKLVRGKPKVGSPSKIDFVVEVKDSADDGARTRAPTVHEDLITQVGIICADLEEHTYDRPAVVSAFAAVFAMVLREKFTTKIMSMDGEPVTLDGYSPARHHSFCSPRSFNSLISLCFILNYRRVTSLGFSSTSATSPPLPNLARKFFNQFIARTHGIEISTSGPASSSAALDGDAKAPAPEENASNLSPEVAEANKRVLAGLTAMGPTYKSMLTKIEALLLQNPRPVASEPFGSFESQVAYAAASANMQQVMQTADFWSSNFSSGGVCEEPNAIVAVVRVVCQSVSANIDPCIVTWAADLNDGLFAEISDESGSRRTTFPDLVSMHGKYVELARVFRNSHDTVAWLLQMRALHVTKLLGTAASLLTTCVEQNPGEIADQVADLSGIAKAVSERLEFAAKLGQQCFD
jgi:hypothetical protein